MRLIRGANARAFVGRRRELAILRHLLDDAVSGRGAAVAVVGEPGIGKTRLLSELVDHAQARGVTVLRGRGAELEQDLPFGLAIEALDEVAAGLGPAALKRLGEERLAELSAVLPSLAREGKPLANPLQVERYRCHYAIRFLLEQLAREQPILLILDDLHWVDQASLELVSYLLRRGVPRSLIALAYRRQAPAQLVETIDRAARERALVPLSLTSLTKPEVAEFLGQELPSSAVEALAVESGGNPFYLDQLARLFREQDLALAKGTVTPLADASETLSEDADVPNAIVSAVREELARLSEKAKRLAEAAAVAGEPFEIDFATAITAADRDTSLAALDELVAAEIVFPTELPGRFVFRHPIVRRAVYDGAGQGWRLGAHERAARALAASSVPIGLRAHHILRSGVQVGDEAAISLLTKAGQTAAPRAPASAARWFAGALRLLPPNADIGIRLSLMLALASTLATIGRLEESRETLEQALDLVPAADTTTRIEITHLIVRAMQGLGRSEEARPLLTAALAQVEPDSPSGISLMLELAKNYFMLRQWSEAIEATENACDIALALGDHKLFVTALAIWAHINANSSPDFRALHDRLDTIASELDRLADHEFDAYALEALHYVVIAETSAEHFGLSARHAQRGLQLCRASGNGTLVIDFLNLLAVARMFGGHLEEARSAAESAVETARLLNNDQALAYTEGTRSWIASLQGDAAAALGAGENAARAAERAPYSIHWYYAHICYGLTLVEFGHYSEGLTRMMAAGGKRLAEVPLNVRPHWLRFMTEAQVALGQIAEAELTADALTDITGTLGLHMRAADAHYARARVSLAQGDFKKAADTASEAQADYDAAGAPIEAARARLLLGQTLLSAEETARAEQEFDRALAVFEKSGAHGLADHANRQLRQLGRDASPKPRDLRKRPGRQTLSNREWEVIELVAQGYTNRQIAESIYISPKTVETHLKRIFSKLGVRSRAAMVAEIERERHRH